MQTDASRESDQLTLQILALDGGGLRGIYSAAALAAWEDDFSTRVSDHFDLITGTSTGGIIALGLGLGLRPRDMLDLYVDHADRVFPPGRRRLVSVLSWSRRPKYSSIALRRLLDEQFGDRVLGDSKVRLAIPSYDLATDDVHLFRTPHHPELRRDWRELAVDVAMATASAPAYMPASAVRAHRLIDGGVWANNPTLVGIAEAVDRLDASLGRIRVLSVGTATELKNRDVQLDRGGLWAWRRDALEIVLRGQSLATTNHARLLLGRSNVVRVDVAIPPGRHALDSVDARDLTRRPRHRAATGLRRWPRSWNTPRPRTSRSTRKKMHMQDPDRHADLSELLRGTADALDITPEQYQLAVERYEDLGRWLVDRGIGDPDVYAQGSFRLGTVVRPAVDGQYDIDLVFWRDLKRGSITQEELKRQAGELLEEYVARRGALIGMPKLEEKGRCWCLNYDEDGFHMDVLPVIPDDEGDETSILLTDRDLRRWQHSNPIGYADWFWAAMGDTVEVGQAALANNLGRDIEDVPRWLVRTPLQRVVQLIKRHRDLFFADNPEAQPASILLTTLAARGYRGEITISAALEQVVGAMPTHIEVREDGLWVPNPAQPEENFADKWKTDPDRKQHFDTWLRALSGEVAGWSSTAGLEAIASSMSDSFGPGPVTTGAKAFADRLSEAGAAGALGVTAAGRVTRSAPNPIPKHTFNHGQRPPR